jgi:hypothetical protein
MFGFLRKKKKKVEEPKKVTPVVKEEKVEEPVVEEAPVEEPKEEKVEVKEEPKEEVKEEKKEEPVKRKRKAINHITKHKDGGWQIKKEGSSRAQKRFSTQKEAIEFAKSLEKTTGTSYIIHKADGSTRKKTY